MKITLKIPQHIVTLCQVLELDPQEVFESYVDEVSFVTDSHDYGNFALRLIHLYTGEVLQDSDIITMYGEIESIYKKIHSYDNDPHDQKYEQLKLELELWNSRWTDYITVKSNCNGH
jgi:hypothetical protein